LVALDREPADCEPADELPLLDPALVESDELVASDPVPP
jgi:hypothetical protein